ncbi:MAG: bifunctional phosphoribosylaminoimidazolecarboxamide formyltransferase/IMP cyclohydrolase [Acidimicrobiia bacterium]
MSRIGIKRALISVSDKTDLVPFAAGLVEHGVEIVSSGGTASHLEEAGVRVTRVRDVTNAEEMLGGRVKTLHPSIHGGILADLGLPDHRSDLDAFDIAPFELVVVNLYPFEATVATGADYATVIENIDIGGPTLIRAAAKNHAWVAVVVSPDQYGEMTDAVAAGGTTAALRADLARAAFYHTARYDAAIVNWFEREDQERIVLPLQRHQALRYGENPQQEAALYALEGSPGWWTKADQLQGKGMSFNNFADADAAWRLVNDLPANSVAILKHMNACGAATAGTVEAAFTKAWECDPVSAFGGVIATNAGLDAATAEAITAYFVEIIIAPSITPDARQVLASKTNLRVLTASSPSNTDLDLRSIDGGFLIQQRDVLASRPDAWESKAREPTAGELEDLAFAWTVCAHTKSNAIVLVKDGATVGVGAGDQSRVGAAERALARAGDRAKGAVCASDAFFPFRDGPDLLARAGITAIVEPGGSIRDAEVVESAVEHDVALLFTGERHFRH